MVSREDSHTNSRVLLARHWKNVPPGITPIAAFLLFFDEELVQHILSETQEKPSKSTETDEEVDEDASDHTDEDAGGCADEDAGGCIDEIASSCVDGIPATILMRTLATLQMRMLVAMLMGRTNNTYGVQPTLVREQLACGQPPQKRCQQIPQSGLVIS